MKITSSNCNFDDTYSSKPIVKPTKFNIEYTKNVKELLIKVNPDSGAEVIVREPRLDMPGFVKVSFNLLDRVGEKVSDSNNKFIFDAYSYSLIFYIMTKLKYNSNAVRFEINDAAKTLNISRDSVIRAINALCKNNIIARTTSQSVYIVNHNCLFKGDINEFVVMYKELYKGEYAKTDNNGKIIIK